MGLELVQEHRGISVKTLEDMGVWWDDEDDYAVKVPYPHMTGEWYTRSLLSPIVERGKRPKVLSPKNANHHMYNPLKLGPNAELVFFCEGEYDTLSVIDCGYPAVGSQGTNTFNPVWGRLYGGATNCIAFDGDSAGVTAARTLRKFFRAQGSDAYILDMEEGTDLNDLHQQGILGETIREFLEENEIEYER